MGGGGGGGGQACEVLPLRKEGMEKVEAMLKGGGGTKRFGVVFMRKVEALAILKVGAQQVSTL